MEYESVLMGMALRLLALDSQVLSTMLCAAYSEKLILKIETFEAF